MVNTRSKQKEIDRKENRAKKVDRTVKSIHRAPGTEKKVFIIGACS